MIKFLFFLVLGYFFFKFVNQAIFGIAGSGNQQDKFSGYSPTGKEKDISDKARVIKD